MSVPISIWMKRYTPLFAGAIIGTGADVWEAKVKCGRMADEVSFDSDYNVQLDDIIDERENLEKSLQEQSFYASVCYNHVIALFINESILDKGTRKSCLGD